MSNLKPLQFRNVGANVRVAKGHYGGWTYQLDQVWGPGGWDARFYDETGNSHILARNVNFAAAKAAANKHHQHPGF